MKLVLGAVAAATWLAGGCGGPDPAERAHFSTIQKEILTPSCALSSCHGGSRPTGELDLREGHALESLINVESTLQTGTRRVVPGSAKDSLLYQAITGTATDVQQMPPGVPLSDEDLEAIRIWIDNGAKND